MMDKYLIKQTVLNSLLILINLLIVFDVNAQFPPIGESCTVSAGNRNAPLAVDGSYLITGIPGNLGAIRARVTCSDGSIGQSSIGFTDPTQSITIPLGPIVFGQMDTVPLAVNLSAAETNLNTGESSQLSLQAVDIEGNVRDVTSREEGTIYSISNELLGDISEDGLVSITSTFDMTSSSRLVASATTEGSVSSTYQYVLGPVGELNGTVYKSDGVTIVVGAQVSVLRLQPLEEMGTVITDINGQFHLSDVSAGTFKLSVIDPSNGDRAFATAVISSESEIIDVSIILTGQGNINVTVVDENNNVTSGKDVTLSLLGQFNIVKTLTTNTSGFVSFEDVQAGDFTISTMDPATEQLATIVDNIGPNETKNITLQLQKTGVIAGVVYEPDGLTIVPGVQVRVLSRQRGVISQFVTQADGSFSFDALPIDDGPFILDAFVDTRLRGRVPGLEFLQGDSILNEDIILSAVGVVKGVVENQENTTFINARVTMQSLEGLNLSFDAVTNNEGRFTLPSVPLGEFELTAVTEDGQTGRASGIISYDSEIVELPVIITSNTIVGTVYERDGFTNVAAGVNVYLVPRTVGEQYSYQDNVNALITLTDENGRYGFQVTSAGDYYVQAESGLDRGRSRAILVNLDPSQPLETDVVFLAKGQINGVVTDANGISQDNVTVKILTEGAFDSTRTIQTNQLGEFSLDGVFAGSITATAFNEQTSQSGLRQTRLDTEGELVEIDIILSASGSIEGRILQADGNIVSSDVSLKIYSNDKLFAIKTFDNGSYYNFNYVPTGDVKIFAEVISTGNKGKATTRINSLNETKNVDLTLVGQGTIQLTLVDIDNNIVSGATVIVSTDVPFRSNQELISNSSGNVTFERVFAGDYSISANKIMTFGSLFGSDVGTLIANDIKQITIQLDSVAVGSISGVVYQPDGISPANEGWVVTLLQSPFLISSAIIATTNQNGEYSFNQVNAGNYTLDAYRFFGLAGCPGQDRIRGSINGVNITSQGQVVIADIQLIGQGEVFGLVIDENQNPAANINISLTNPDPVFGANSPCGGGSTFNTTTNGNGEYSINDIPPGNFTIVAQNLSRTLRSEGAGRINFDGDIAEVNLTLVDNAVAMPYDFYDANGFLHDISGDGSIGSGTNNVYASMTPDNAAMRLEIIRNDVAVPFINGNGTIGKLTANGQEIEVDDFTPSGLQVTRRILTPRSGYFSRYLEVLKNPTSQPITVDVRMKSHHRNEDSNPRIVDSSDGDQILSVSNQMAPDRWIIVDDQTDTDPFVSSSIPAVGHVFDGENAVAQVNDASYDLIGQTGRLIYQWDNITIDPNETKILMHFVFGQIQRTGAKKAALRLSNLPPEAIDDLTTEDRQLIINFSVPNQSLVDTLPNLTAGELNGKVLSGDGVTTIADADITYQSQHPLFGRIRYSTSESNGEFRFKSTLDGSPNNYVIPIYDFSVKAKYPVSGLSSAVTIGGFPQGLTLAQQDLVLVGAGDIRGNVTRHNGALVANTDVKLCIEDDRRRCSTGAEQNPSNYAISEADGSYTMLANTPRTYYLFAEKDHPQNSGRNILGQAITHVPGVGATVTNIIMEETGSVSGFVKSANGTAISQATVKLETYFDQDVNPGYRNARSTTSDTAGFYRFYDLPLGHHKLNATDEIDNTFGEAEADVFVDQETTQDIILSSIAQLNVYVKYERGELAANAVVDLIGTNQGTIRQYTNSNGLAQFLVTEGNFEIKAAHPDNIFISNMIPVEILTNDVLVNKTIFLPHVGEVYGTIVRPDNTTLAGGFPYSIEQTSGNIVIGGKSGFTDDVGFYRTSGLPIGNYVITAFDAEQDRFADAEFSITNDGDEILEDLTLLDATVALPADLFDANRFIFDVSRNGSLANGNNSYNNGASLLQINGQDFVGETSARLQAGRRQFAIEQIDTMSNLNITRKIYVPKDGYFARYIEVLENSTTQDITIDVGIIDNYSGGNVISTSSGDNTVTVLDNWVNLDDGINNDILIYPTQMPSISSIFSGESAISTPNIVDVNYDNSLPSLNLEWSQLTVPAGEIVSIMHFNVQQLNREGSQASAERLIQLPPEALLELTTEDINTIINFDVPTGGISALEPIPSLLGNIEGTVIEGNSNTIVPNTKVTIQSMHPLFSRVWGKISSPIPGCSSYPGTRINSLMSSTTGNYDIQGQLTDIDSIPIPIGVDVRVVAQEATECYVYYSGHPFTNNLSNVALIEASGVQDVSFDTAIITGSIIGTPEFSITNGRVYLSIDNPDWPDFQYVSIQSDGSFIYPGLQTGTYDLLFDTSHPDQESNDLLRGSKAQVSVLAGEVLVSDIQLQPTGMVQGSIISFDGSASANAEIELYSDVENQNYNQCESGCSNDILQMNKGKHLVHRKVYSDSLGHYSFSAMPDGQYTMTINGPVSGPNGITNTKVVIDDVLVIANQVNIQNIILPGFGLVTINVETAAGNPISNQEVFIESPNIHDRVSLGETDLSGILIADIPVGSYTLFTKNSLTNQESFANGMVNSDDELSNIDLIVKASANLHLVIIDADNGNAPIQNVSVFVNDINSSTGYNEESGVDGLTIFNNLSETEYSITVRIGSEYDTSFMFRVTPAIDGQTIMQSVSYAQSQHIINNFEFSQAHHLYQTVADAGDTLSLNIRSVTDNNGSACDIELNTYDENKIRLASGIGKINYQVNQLNNILQIPITNDGSYTTMLSAKSSGCFSGSYKLIASIQGNTTPTTVHQISGSVSGTLYQADGSTIIANELVQLMTTDGNPKLYRQQITDANGYYVFNNVPLGNFEIIYVPRNTVTVSGVVSNIGEQVQTDLILSQETTLDINVYNADGLPINYQARIDIYQPGHSVDMQYTNSQGELTYPYFGFDTLYIKTRSITDTNISASQFVEPNDGQTIVVNLVLAPATITGIVFDADGLTPLSNIRVSARLAQNNNYLEDVDTNAQGEFNFDSLPVDNNVYLYARDPFNSALTESQIITTSANQPSFQNIQLKGRGTVFGRVTGVGDTAVVNTYINGYYSQGELYTFTDINGDYSINNLPIGESLTLQYSEYWSFGDVVVSADTTLVNHEDSSEVNLILPGAGITIQLSTADNLPIGGTCNAVLTIEKNSESGGSNEGLARGGGGGPEYLYDVNCDDPFNFVGIPVGVIAGMPDGNVSIEITNWDGETIFEGVYQLVNNQLLEINHVFSVISGIVTFFNSSEVPFAQIYTPDKMVTSNDIGQYRLIGQGQGAFRITAEDTSTSLQTTIDSQVVDVTIPIIQDIQLPASATINGQILDIGGLPMPSINVYAASSNSPVVLQTTSDVNGNYEISNITLGEIELFAINQITNNIASQETSLIINNDVQTQDLQFSQPGSVSGVLSNSNAAIFPNGCVQMRYTKSGVVHQSLMFSTTSDENGLYSFDSAAPGKVMMTGMDECSNPSSTGIELSEIIINTNTSIDIEFGDAEPLMHELNEMGSNFSIQVQANGSIQPVNNSNVSDYFKNKPFIEPLKLTVNGTGLNNQIAAVASASEEELVIGPTTTSAMSISRKVFVPNSGNYTRVLDSVTNTNTTAITVEIDLQGSYGYDDSGLHSNLNVILTANPENNNNRYAILDYQGDLSNQWSNVDPADFPAITGYVFAGNNTLIQVDPNFQNNRSRFSWAWTTTIQPGDTQNFLSYVLVSLPGDVTPVTNLVNEIINGTQVDMFNGLSVDEMNNIVNFETP